MIYTLRQVLLSLLALVLTSNMVVADQDQSDEPFQPSENFMADVDQTIAAALQGDQLALIIMGANWCHDSRGLLDNFTDPELAALLKQNYQTVLVDVGNLERGQQLIARFGMPVIYGTPTVLIIDPKTERLINKDTMFRWRDSAGISVAETLKYFSEMKVPVDVPFDATPELLTLYAQIDAFEEAQAKRIYKGFAVVGPMLGMEDDDRPDHFRDYWHQLSNLRYTITDDLANLRAEAKSRTAAGEENITLDYPEYPAFTWE